MALVDPPVFVSVPPALIYGCEDLEREHYKGLLQVVGWLWVTKKHQGALRTTVEELAGRWGVAVRTAYWRLQRYGELGYLVVELTGQQGRVGLRLGPRAEMGTQNRGASFDNRMQKGNGGTGQGIEGEGETQQGDGGEGLCKQVAQVGDGEGGCASSLHGSYNSSVVGVDPLLGKRKQHHQQDYYCEDVYKVLRLRGVWADKAEALARDSWVTLARVETAWAEIVRQGEAIRNRAAVYAANLGAHREAEGVAVRERYGRG